MLPALRVIPLVLAASAALGAATAYLLSERSRRGPQDVMEALEADLRAALARSGARLRVEPTTPWRD